MYIFFMKNTFLKPNKNVLSTNNNVLLENIFYASFKKINIHKCFLLNIKGLIAFDFIKVMENILKRDYLDYKNSS